MSRELWIRQCFVFLAGALFCAVCVAKECVSGTCIDGFGKAVWSDGASYEGEWRDGRFHGRGLSISASGVRYEGEWRDHQRHGQGKLELTNGVVYDGGWEHGVKSGRATVIWPSSDRYVGEYSANERSGLGTYTWASGREYTGEWLEGEEHGQGTKTLTDGREFNGNWKSGLLHGVVVTTWPSGRKVTARYRNDELIETMSDTANQRLVQNRDGQSHPSHPQPSKMDNRRLTRDIQRLLTALGYRPGVIDGVIGAHTRKAIRSFQRRELLAVDGEVSLPLLTQLEKRIVQGDSESVAEESSVVTPNGALNDLGDLEDF